MEHMKTQNELLIEVLATAQAAWAKLQRQHGAMVFPSFALSNRFTRTAGHCLVLENKIVIGTKFMIQHPEIMHNVIIPHELCHQVDFNKNGFPKGNRWHGKSWQIIMIQYGLPADTYHTMEIVK